VIIPGIGIALFLLARRKRRERFARGANRESHGQKVRQHTGTQYTASVTGPSKSRIVPQSTRNGEVVKSGGERMIADYLYANGIRYEYEKPAMDATGRRISRPDFFLPDHNIYVEYWGMVNSDEKHERQEYVKSMEWKIKRYHESGNKFISIYPEDLGNLDTVLKARL
jgi:hypothetical protein